MCPLLEEFGSVWPNTATKGSKSRQDWHLRFLRMAFIPAITIKWMVTVVWSLPAVKLHLVRFKLEWVTAEMECAVGGSTEGNFWSNDGKTIMFWENMCYLLSYREGIVGLTVYSGRICQILLG